MADAGLPPAGENVTTTPEGVVTENGCAKPAHRPVSSGRAHAFDCLGEGRRKESMILCLAKSRAGPQVGIDDDGRCQPFLPF